MNTDSLRDWASAPVIGPDLVVAAGTVVLVPSLPSTPLTIDALLRVVAERDAEVALLKHMVDKLKLQLARRVREQYGVPASSSTRS